MTTTQDDDVAEIRASVRALCARFPGAYWRELDHERRYPQAFVDALTEAGMLAVLIPEQYGGSGLGLAAAAAILEEIHKAGCNGAARHAQMYTMGTLLKHGNAQQKAQYLPEIAAGRLRLQAFGVTEPSAGTDTTAIKTTARRDGARYVVNGQKVWTSRAEHSDLMLLLARTTPRDQVARRTDGLSVFLVDLRESIGKGLTVRLIRTMMNHATTELFDELPVPAANLTGEEGKGFRYILDGMNAGAHPDRVGMHRRRAGSSPPQPPPCQAARRFRRLIGQNQGIQFLIARAWRAGSEAAALMVREAARKFDAGEPCGPQANMAKLLAADAAWAAADMCIQTHGGFGFAEEFDVERKFRETRLYQVAPVSTNLILAYLAEHVLELPRSY